MIISAIVAFDLNRAIGLNNKLLWHLPADLNYFKTLTMGCPIIMGRKTFESIGRLLPGRKNIIISRNLNYSKKGAEIFSSFENAIKNCSEDKVFIIGGAEIYNLSIPFLDELYVTLIKDEFKADTFFPQIKDSEFILVSEECFIADEKNKFDYCFQKYIKIK